MKTFTINCLCKTLLSFVLIFLFHTSYSQEVLSKDGEKYIKVNLNSHGVLSTALIISHFEKLEDAKVVISEEAGIIYIYPYKDNIQTLEKQVKSIIRNSDKIGSKSSKERTAAMMDSLNEKHGDWLGRYAQVGGRELENDSCHTSKPFCTGSIYVFPAGTNTQAQVGPYYGCLSTRPNPAWYHLRIANPGNITIKMFSTPSRDIDFCLWGPYTDPITPCPMNASQGGLTQSKIEDCSYSTASVEYADIIGGLTGEYYILVITNYSNQPCDITFQQTAGNGTTDCTILPPPAQSNSPLCVGGTLMLSASTVLNATYHWTGPNGWSSNQQNPVINNVTMAHAGEYTLILTINGQNSQPTSTTVAVYNPPVGTLSGGATICEGDSTKLTLTCNGPAPYRALVSTGPGFPMIINFNTSPLEIWVKPTSTVTYNLIGIRNAACDGTHSGSATVTVNAKPQTNFTFSNPCATLVTQFTDQTVVPGGGVATWQWSFGDLSGSSVQNPTHTYVNPSTYNVSLKAISNGGCEKQITIPVTINPTPAVDAGADVSIPHTTSTTLTGIVTGGSGTHSYNWTPSDLVVSPTNLTTNTQLLTTTTDFTLTALDANGCQKSDNVLITVFGGPLSSTININNPQICVGGNATLSAFPSGGSGEYTYSWTSNPPGFTSNLSEITVNPVVTTTYILVVNDGYSIYQAQKTLTVNNNPVVITNDLEIPHGTSTTLTSSVTGNPIVSYQWSPPGLLLNPTSASTQTINLYNSTSFSLTVSDVNGCIGTDNATVTISGGPLSVNPQAVDSVICRNQTTKLKALAGGGNLANSASYNWTSKPAGFTSNIAEPNVSPVITTMYYVSVYDGYNTTSDSVQVKVNQLPVINLIPNDPRVQKIDNNTIGICVFDSVALNAGNPGAVYLWSNGASTQSITIATSGISFDQQSYSVTVTNPQTGCTNNSNITANFTFQNCSYGIEEIANDEHLKIYPNPSNGVFNIVADKLQGNVNIEIFNAHGKILYMKEYKIDKGAVLKDEINLSNLPVGVYFIKLKNSDTLKMRKLVIR